MIQLPSFDVGGLGSTTGQSVSQSMGFLVGRVSLGQVILQVLKFSLAVGGIIL
jgi:hypothetical protein